MARLAAFLLLNALVVDSLIRIGEEKASPEVALRSVDYPRRHPQMYADTDLTKVSPMVAEKRAFVTMWYQKKKSDRANLVATEKEERFFTEAEEEEHIQMWAKQMANTTTRPLGDMVGALKQRYGTGTKGNIGIPGHNADGVAYSFQTVLSLYEELKKTGTKYPFVVLTNHPELLKMTSDPNFIPVKMHGRVKRGCVTQEKNAFHIQKLLIWRLTDWDKLLWMDVDVHPRKNIDHVFNHDLKGGKFIVGQEDDYTCDHERSRMRHGSAWGFCSGMMLMQPRERDFKGLDRTQRTMGQCWGDQTIIKTYFGERAKFFHTDTVSFAKCLPDGLSPAKEDRDPLVVHDN